MHLRLQMRASHVRYCQAESYQGYHPGYIHKGLRRNKGNVSPYDNGAILYRRISADLPQRPYRQPRQQPTQQRSYGDHKQAVQHRRRGCARRCIGSIEQHEEDNASPIVKHRLGIHQRGEPLACPQLPQEGDDSYRVGRANQSSEHQGVVPVPSAALRDERGYPHNQGGRQEHGYHHPRTGQQGRVEQ